MQHNGVGRGGVGKNAQQVRIRHAVVNHQRLAMAHRKVNMPAQGFLLLGHGRGGLRLVLHPVGIEAGLSHCYAARIRHHLLQCHLGRCIQLVGAHWVDGTGGIHIRKGMCSS